MISPLNTSLETLPPWQGEETPQRQLREPWEDPTPKQNQDKLFQVSSHQEKKHSVMED